MTAPDQPVSPHDARAVANLLLKLAQAKGLSVTNLSLQKLIYFAHGLMLRRHRRPLVDGYFEAWDYGPVHPLLYSCFKSAGRSPILHPALKRDLRRGLSSPVEMDADAEAEGVVSEVLDALGHQPAGRLVRMSHARGGPWHEVVNESGTLSGLGLRISDMLIRERFHRHLVSVGSADDRTGEAFDESPPT